MHYVVNHIFSPFLKDNGSGMPEAIDICFNFVVVSN